MGTFTLEPQYLFKLASMTRGFTSQNLVDYRCMVPSYTLVIDFLGNCLLCDCDGWLPIPVGKVQDFQTIDEVFACESARMIQEDVAQNKFSWCAVDHCGIRQGDKIRTEINLSINIDESCNLHCPSCRRDPIMLSQGPEYEQKRDNIKRIQQWLENYDKKIHITMSGNGDPLASHIMRPLIRNFVPQKNQEFTIFTNGLLLKKHLAGFPILNHLRAITISVDAGSAEVYQNVRRPGRWDVLLENFNFIRDLGLSKITKLNFAFQQANFHDLPNFVELCARYGFWANVHQLDDWGTWSQIEPKVKDTWTIENGIFRDHDVLAETHPEHDLAKKVIEQYLGQPKVGFSPYIINKIQR